MHSKYPDDFSSAPRREKIKKSKRGPETSDPPTRKYSRKDDGRTDEFRCRNCQHMIGPPPAGTRQRNHCPVCLHSLHVDEKPGDRASSCRSIMEPIAIWVRDEEWVLLHRCRGCGRIKSNRVAPDDNEVLLISLAVKPIGSPAFPLGDPGVWKMGR